MFLEVRAWLQFRLLTDAAVLFRSARLIDDEDDDSVSDSEVEFTDQNTQEQSADEAFEANSDDSGVGAKKKPAAPTRTLAARGGARDGIYKESSSGEDEDGSSSGARSERQARHLTHRESCFPCSDSQSLRMHQLAMMCRCVKGMHLCSVLHCGLIPAT